MKKTIVLGAACLMALALAACGSGALADGVYTAEADNAYVEQYGYGWRDTLTLTVQDGKVVGGEYTAYDADGNKKSTPGNYTGMTPPPEEWMPALSAQLAGAASPDDIDAIAGATIGSDNVRQLFTAIQKSGKPGETIQVSLEPPA